jgi:hypothetical protein
MSKEKPKKPDMPKPPVTITSDRSGIVTNSRDKPRKKKG